MAEPGRIAHDALVEFFRDVLMAAGVPDRVAAIEAEIGAEVDLCGVHTHGARLLPTTVDNIRRGVTRPDPSIEIVQELAAMALAEADQGIGRYVSAMAVDMAMERAQAYGIGAVAVRNVAHWGRGFSYALRAARRGFIGVAFTNAIVNFPAWGTKVPSLGNNPMAIGVPTGDDEPVVLDMAMTQSSIGRVRQAAAAGERVPVGWGLDVEGEPTDDPQLILESMRLLPMGEHKGSALAFAIELLTAGLANGLLCYEQGVDGKATDTEGGSTKLFIALRPFGDWLESKSADLKDHLRASPKFEHQGPAQWPGEGSYRRRREYLERGIALPEALMEDLQLLARELGVEFRRG